MLEKIVRMELMRFLSSATIKRAKMVRSFNALTAVATTGPCFVMGKMTARMDQMNISSSVLAII